MKYINKYIQYFDDERKIGNGVIVTLHYGWSFEAKEHSGVKGFDTVSKAIEASKRKNIFPCNCRLCLSNGKAV